ncbi:unnamed protein product [Choristocarpus tenellus]
MLEYDNCAFYYFTLSLVSICLVPVTITLASQVYCTAFAERDGRIGTHKSAQKFKFSKLRKDRLDVDALRTLVHERTFMTKAMVVVLGWCVLMYLVSSIRHSAEIVGFDPYAILGFPPGAVPDPKDVKRVYRNLLKLNPTEVSVVMSQEEISRCWKWGVLLVETVHCGIFICSC